jgi:hypothetical protein
MQSTPAAPTNPVILSEARNAQSKDPHLPLLFFLSFPQGICFYA